MPRLLLLATVLLLAAGPVVAQPSAINEAVSAGGAAADVGESVALAPDGSHYVVGTFEGTASFGDLAITSAGDSDAFLVKYDDALDAVWARRGGTDVFNDFGTAVAVAPDGSVYAAGFFTGIATWDGGTNPDIELTTFSDFDAFVAKYTPEGDLEWVRQAGGVGQDTGRDLAVDADGNVYFVGGFEGTGTFGSVVLESAGSTDAFLVKYDPDGNVIWARRGGSDQGDLAYGVAVTGDGQAHVSGSFRGVALFGALPIQSAGNTDVFVAQYDADGEAVWVEGLGADGAEFTRGGGIGLGPDGSVYLQGSFSNTILVGSDVLVSQGFTDIFVARLDADGEAVWGRRGGGDGTNFSAALAVDASGNALITGYADGTGTFADEAITTQGRDGYFAVFDSAGDLLTVDLLGGTGQDAGGGVAVSADRFAATGSFRGAASFGDFDLTSAGSSDVYVVGGEGQTFIPSVIYVDADATGADNGSSWADAFTDLQDALALAATIDVDPLAIWVAEGTYYPTDGFDRRATFELFTGIAVYGGFSGVETTLEERDPDTYETVLSGDIGTPDDNFDNSYHVIVAVDVDGGTLDGLMITEGTGTGASTSPTEEDDTRGGGLQAIDSSIDINRCIFRSNRAYGNFYPGLGGGLYAEDSAITVSNSLFDANTAHPGKGGGIYAQSTSLSLSNVMFEFNTASLAGGGLSSDGGTVDIVGSRFSENLALGTPDEMSSGGDGGGAYVVNGISPGTLIDTVFDGNSANQSGGGWYAGGSEITYRGLVFSDNVAEGTGGGIYHGGYQILDFDDVAMIGNGAASGGGLYTNVFDAIIRGSRFVRNTADSGASALTLLGFDSYVVNTSFDGNASASGPVIDFWQMTTPIVANSTFVGNMTANGILLCAITSVKFVNSTVVSNAATKGDAGGIDGLFKCQIEVQNAVLWRNSGDQASDDAVITHSIVEGGFGGEAVIDADPLFVRAPSPGDDGEWGTEDDDYGDLRLQQGSPAVDFGLAAFLPPDTFDLDGDGDTEEPLPLDLDGNPRVQGSEVDLGAYESPFTVALEPGAGVPTANSLATAYPNPFRDWTTLALDVAEAQDVTVTVFDVLGRRVAEIHDGPLEVGAHRVVIEAGSLPAGVYVVRAEGETFSQSQRITVVH